MCVIMEDYFGKNCHYMTGAWIDVDNRFTYEKRDWQPELIYCEHDENPDPEQEGNCFKEICPLIKAANRLKQYINKQRQETKELLGI